MRAGNRSRLAVVSAVTTRRRALRTFLGQANATAVHTPAGRETIQQGPGAELRGVASSSAKHGLQTAGTGSSARQKVLCRSRRQIAAVKTD
jgi:hypothetical protein